MAEVPCKHQARQSLHISSEELFPHWHYSLCISFIARL